MYIENGYIVKDTEDKSVVLLEIKTFANDIGSNFYEIMINKVPQYDETNIAVSCRSIANPIEYMQEVSKESPLSLNSLIVPEKLGDYYDYLVQVGIIKETNESVRQDFKYKGIYSLKNSKYNTQDESIYERKIK